MPLFRSGSSKSVGSHNSCYDRKEGEEGFSTISLHHGHKVRAPARRFRTSRSLILMDASPKNF